VCDQFEKYMSREPKPAFLKPKAAARGSETDPTHIDVQSFTKALVAGLVQLNVDAVSPHNTRDRRGFEKIVRVLDRTVQRLRKERVPSKTLLAVARLANELRASDVGTYEGFEAALRSLQLTFTSSPNPFYDDIDFPVSKTQAKSYIDNIPTFQKDLALSAAKTFVAERNKEIA
jgi:hypothetical protein